MKSYDIIGYVDFDDLVHLCDECGVDGQHHPIFVSDAEDALEHGEICDRCRCLWDREWYEWRPDEPTAVEVMREAVHGR